MKDTLRYALIAMIGLHCRPVPADTSDWYKGGSYDGYAVKSDAGYVADLGVNNASGATNITPSNAWLNGVLVSTTTGEMATVRVYWGTQDGTTNFGNWAHTNEFGSATEGQVLTTNVSVSANTTYYYRFYATNDQPAEGWAAVSAIFITAASPVVDTATGASPVGLTTATLNGNFTAGVSADLYVYWGTNDGGTTNRNWAQTNSLGGSTMGAFATPVAGLSPGILYYYRCYGTNAYGEGWSAVASFSTRSGAVHFTGGGYDGYAVKSDAGYVGDLGVNNASGATNVTLTNAWLNGALVSTLTGETATVRVYWGPQDGTTNLGNWVHTNEFGSATEGQCLTTNVSVSANTTYYYRFYATNDQPAEGWAAVSASFITPAPPSVDSATGASPVGRTTATLNGNLTAGFSADLYIYWGENDGGTTNYNWARTNSLGWRSVGAFATPVAGLNPGTLYCYRCYGTNAYGEGWSTAVVFTTRAGSAHFTGGSYDGYDQRSDSLKMNTGNFGTVIILF